MHDPYDLIPFFDGLTSSQQEALRAALDADPVLAEAAAQWQQVRASVRHSVHTQVPDRRMFVLYALEASGRADVLTDEERGALNAARPALDAALQTHPALVDVIKQVETSCVDFEEAWALHVTEQPVTEQTPASPDVKHREPQRRPARRVLRWTWRIAAAVAFVAFATVMTLLIQRDGSLTTVAAAEGETRVIELADGSTVRLQGSATLTYTDPAAATAFNRHVQLTGAAFFEVVPGQQGFTVETPTALTTVLGTSFGIRADDDAMEVVLATGSISVASKAARDQVVVLQPGEMSRVARNALPSTPAPVELVEALEWTGLFLFQATPLHDAAARLNEVYGVTITVSPELEAERISGTFAREDAVEHILHTLATTLDAVVEGADATGYTIHPKARQ